MNGSWCCKWFWTVSSSTSRTAVIESLSIIIKRTVCCRNNPCWFHVTAFSFSSFYLFFFLQKRDEIAFIIHCFLAQGEGNNVCCKRTITVIFRTVISICKFQTISYFSHYLQIPLSRCLLGASTSFSVVFYYHNL